ncbi:hypothetical protein E2C01_016685 [Portunus trituberculatus]|uniref:Uncharacterized protein n=1 Tax=Portunus trituberculatus TaxID=210409 RepID=A0A5B7DR75_PORTR|nr:hypothetical protein [Portunus trituberculatus]
MRISSGTVTSIVIQRGGSSGGDGEVVSTLYCPCWVVKVKTRSVVGVGVVSGATVGRNAGPHGGPHDPRPSCRTGLGRHSREGRGERIHKTPPSRCAAFQLAGAAKEAMDWLGRQVHAVMIQ